MMWTGQGWNLYLRRYLNDWEIGRITEFYNSVARFNNLTEEVDRLEWNRNSKGIFSVKSAYRELNVEVGKERDWPWKMIWKPKIPYKVNCFIWLLAKEAVLTHDNLNKRGHQLTAGCFLCGEQAETINHLFLHGKWTDQLWRMFISLKGISWVKPGSIADVLRCWNMDGNTEGTVSITWRQNHSDKLSVRCLAYICCGSISTPFQGGVVEKRLDATRRNFLWHGLARRKWLVEGGHNTEIWETGTLVPKPINTTFGVDNWKFIRALWEILQLILILPWEWLLLQHNATTSNVRSQRGWDLTFRKALNDWELGIVADFYQALEARAK
ncbi:hypothetical protein MTR67_026395 [Solanum verrucosum]|uniref:Reverse transcriptase zinc-binding domain-containing protein n=1 Tax=Solanum verrucosum TaxID=315347 RepID=A0AAF0TZ66_SOLVR|nr:hypothetical protein MTR67_026395 [Solanum verrucosum]